MAKSERIGAVAVSYTHLDVYKRQALMECLKTLDTERGLLSMRSVDLAENWEMRDLASALGFHSSPDPTDSHQVIHTISLVCDVVPTTAPIRSDLAI